MSPLTPQHSPASRAQKWPTAVFSLMFPVQTDLTTCLIFKKIKSVATPINILLQLTGRWQYDEIM